MTWDDTVAPPPDRPVRPARNDASAVGHAGLFTRPTHPAGGPGRLIAVMVVAGITAGLMALLIPAVNSSRRTHASSLVTGHAAHLGPLELTSLTHHRDGPNWTVDGVVRNPDTGVALEHLTVVTFLFDRHGTFLTSGRAMLAADALSPGRESSFRVTVATSARVGHYRVSFRTSDGAVILHHDRRGPSNDRRRADPAAPTTLARATW